MSLLFELKVHHNTFFAMDLLLEVLQSFQVDLEGYRTRREGNGRGKENGKDERGRGEE